MKTISTTDLHKFIYETLNLRKELENGKSYDWIYSRYAQAANWAFNPEDNDTVWEWLMDYFHRQVELFQRLEVFQCPNMAQYVWVLIENGFSVRRGIDKVPFMSQVEPLEDECYYIAIALDGTVGKIPLRTFKTWQHYRSVHIDNRYNDYRVDRTELSTIAEHFRNWNKEAKMFRQDLSLIFL